MWMHVVYCGIWVIIIPPLFSLLWAIKINYWWWDGMVWHGMAWPFPNVADQIQLLTMAPWHIHSQSIQAARQHMSQRALVVGAASDGTAGSCNRKGRQIYDWWLGQMQRGQSRELNWSGWWFSHLCPKNPSQLGSCFLSFAFHLVGKDCRKLSPQKD